MAKIPMLIKPYDDEMMYSYIHRLAKALNMDYMFFWKHYVQPQYGFEKSQRILSPLRYDSNSDLSTLFSQLQPLIGTDAAISDFYRDHMMYTGFAPALNEYQQARWINLSARAGGVSTSLVTQMSGANITELKICPQCIGTDAFHFKRVHQMPGVKVCPIHGTPLLKYVGKQGCEFKKAAFTPVLNVLEATETDKDYALFSTSILHKALETNANELTAAIKSKMKSVGFTKDNTDCIVTYAKSLGRSLYCTQEILDYAVYIYGRVGAFKREFSPEKLYSVLFILFEDVNDIKAYIQPSFPSKDEFVKYIEPRGYELVSSYHRQVITLKHISCGTTFISTPEMFLNGWECPICDGTIDEKDLFKRIITRTYNGKYSLQSEYKSFGEPVLVKHLTCGKTFSVPPYRLFTEKFRCNCTDYHNSQEYADKTMEKYPEWKLIKFSGSSNPATLMHKPCGCVVEIPRFTFLEKRSTCEKCAAESFGKRLEATYGDKITALEAYVNYTTSINFKCGICGAEFSRTPHDLFCGNGCPECSKKTIFTFEELVEYVRILSSGRYEIEGLAKPGQFMVRDTSTGDMRVYSKQIILQELLRPTQSSLFPTAGKEKVVERIQKAEDVILEYLRKNKDAYKYFFYEDLYNALVNSKTLSREDFLLGWYQLLPYDHFRQICKTLNAFVLKDAPIDYCELLEKKYCLDDSGNHIGFLFGNCFLEQLGIKGKNNSTISIVSNKQTDCSRSRHVIDGIVFNVFMPTYGPVTESNYKYKMIISSILGNSIKKEKQILIALGNYIRENNLCRSGFTDELQAGYMESIKTRVNSILDEITRLGIPIS